MGDIGQRIGQLIVAQRALAPIGKTTAFINFSACGFADKCLITDRIAKAAHHGGNLRVKKRFRNGFGLMIKNFNILAAAMHDFQHFFIGQQRVKRR